MVKLTRKYSNKSLHRDIPPHHSGKQAGCDGRNNSFSCFQRYSRHLINGRDAAIAKYIRLIALIILISLILGIFYIDSILDWFGRAGNDSLAQSAFSYMDEESLQKALYGLEKVTALELKIDGIACAYDQTENTYYYPLPEAVRDEAIFSLHLDSRLPGERIYLENTLINLDEGIVLERNQPYDITVINAYQYGQCKLVFTALPLLVFDVPAQITQDEALGEMRILDPEYAAHGLSQLQFVSEATVAYRGAISRAYSKKNYKLKLLKTSGQEKMASLLGMRPDGDWILEGMYNDYAKMRKKVSMDLWMELSTVYYDSSVINGVNGAYVEAFFDDQYHGLYLLHERLDQKQLGLAKNVDGRNGGIIYKGDIWNDADHAVISFSKQPGPIEPQNEQWSGFSCRYPKFSDVGWINWEPMYEFCMLVTTATDEEFVDRIDTYIDYDNIIEGLLLLEMMGGDDNRGKNMIWSIADARDPHRSKLMLTMWDMDATWGRNWLNEIRPADKKWVTNGLFNRFLKQNPDEFVSKLQQKWDTLRKDVFSLESLTVRFEREYKLLEESGALAREKKRWDSMLTTQKHRIIFATVDVAPEIHYIKEWIAQRLVYLDGYISSLGDEE